MKIRGSRFLGFYSKKAHKITHSCIYETPDGKEVELTCVTENPDDYKWDDKVCVGPVTRFLRIGKEGTKLRDRLTEQGHHIQARACAEQSENPIGVPV